MEKPSDPTAEIEELKARLAEAEETLNAIRSGEVDALVVAGSDGDQVFTLKGAEMPYRILVEEMNQGALMIIPDGTILYANARFAGLTKTPLEQIIGASWQQFFPREKHPQLEACLATERARLDTGSEINSGAVEGRAHHSVRAGAELAKSGAYGVTRPTTIDPVTPPEEFSLQAADGCVSPVHLSLRSMSASGVAGFSVIITDLTERRQSEGALQKISDELLEKNGQLEAFSYSISHDLRAPLRAMQGFAKILVEDYGDKLGPEPKSYLERIQASGHRLDRLIHDVLAYSKSSSDHKELAVFDLDKLVREMVETYPNLREENIELVPSSARVLGYEVALVQCISNLLANAIKFVPKNSIPRVKVWTEATNGRLRLWVQDNGIGISPHDQERIFDVFSRVHSNEDYEGTGLGLCMVKKAVEKMGGRVGVESELGQGSRFWIELRSA